MRVQASPVFRSSRATQLTKLTSPTPSCCICFPTRFPITSEPKDLCCLQNLSVGSRSEQFAGPESKPGDKSSSRSGWILRSIWPFKGEIAGSLSLASSRWFRSLFPASVPGHVSIFCDFSSGCCRCKSWDMESASLSNCFLSRLSIRVLRRCFIELQTTHSHDCWCLEPFPLGGWRQTMHTQPGLWRGCFVLFSDRAERPSPSPWIAKLASASSPSRAPNRSGSRSVASSFLEESAQYSNI